MLPYINDKFKKIPLISCILINDSNYVWSYSTKNDCCSSELSLYLNLKSPSKPRGASPSLGTHCQ